MNQNEVNKTRVDKMQQDLDAVRDVLGCELPFDRAYVRLMLAIAVTAGVWCVWSLFFTKDDGFWLMALGAGPMALVSMAGSFWWWRRSRAWRKEHPLAAKAFTLDVRITVIFLLAFFGSTVICLKTGVARPALMAMIFFWVAVLFFLTGMTGRARRYHLGTALGFATMCPTMYFLNEDSLAVTWVAASTVLMAMVSAGIIHGQLRRHRGA
ncbi:MAG: hypothetical protein FWE88_04385 [Phycisphaerae bacterium]|nr:hypothetical protein [Phycisphaerae bacterium]